MTIEGKVKNKAYLTVDDVFCGECFNYLNDTTVLLKVNSDNFVVSIEDGELLDVDSNRPVQTVSTHLVIDNN